MRKLTSAILAVGLAISAPLAAAAQQLAGDRWDAGVFDALSVGGVLGLRAMVEEEYAVTSLSHYAVEPRPVLDLHALARA